MGIFHSKVAPVNKDAKSQPDDSLDPRSPTVNINRTPISPIGLEAALEKPPITKMRDLTADLTEILDNAQTPDRVVVIGEQLQSVLDPRSPGSFARTPLVLDDSNASIISLQATSLEYEEISCIEEELLLPQEEQSSLSFKDCDEAIPEIVSTDPIEGGSLFSDTSLNTELKADIEGIIQKLYDAGIDPRSPSIVIQRTPIVFGEEEQNESECGDKAKEHVSQQNQQQQQHIEEETEKTIESKTNTTLTIIHRDENQLDATPKRAKGGEMSAHKAAAARTPLGCVTNVNTPSKLGGADMRKTALFGQMKQNVSSVAVTAVSSAETIPGKKFKPRSKIPTLRMK